MAQTCPITNKGSLVKGGYSNRTRATKFNPIGKKRAYPNLQKKTYFIPELGKKVSVRISTQGIRTITKNGVYPTLKKAGLI